MIDFIEEIAYRLYFKNNKKLLEHAGRFKNGEYGFYLENIGKI